MSVEEMASDSPQHVVHSPPPQRSSMFVVAKRLAQTFFTALILPRMLAFYLSEALLGRTRAFIASSESIARIPGHRGVLLRQAFYRSTLATCGQDVYFGWNSTFSMTEAEVSDRVYIGRSCSIGFARIGAEAMLADHVQVLSGGREHAMADDERGMQEQSQTYQQVSIGSGAWIGAGAIIMADVGDGAVIGAGAVVNKAIPARTVAVGVPARVVKTLNNDSASVESEPAYSTNRFKSGSA